MNGRELYKKFEFFINLLVKLMKVMPKKMSQHIWYRTEGWHGYIGKTLRFAILKAKCKKAGSAIMIGPFVEIQNMEKLNIGSGSAINRGCYLDAFGEIEIGENVGIAHGVSIVSFNHDSKRGVRRKELESIPKKIIIDDNVWIGAGARILAGVTIGHDAVIGAGAVVTKDVAPETVVGGVPAKFIKNVYED